MIRYYYICIFVLINIIKISAQDFSVNFSKSEKACEPGSAKVDVVSAHPVQILWSNGLNSSNINQLEAGDYNVTVSDEFEHDTTIFFSIETITCEPVAQNHFTPNDDGFNDTWSISRLENFPEFELYVYNRWGQLVHRQANQYIPWDGRSLTLPLPDATYYYILYFSKNDKNKFIKGDISIIR